MDRVIGPRTKRIAALAALALLLLALPGCSSARKRQAKLSEDNEALYREARAMIEGRRFQQATQVLGDVGMVSPVGETLDPMVKLALADSYFFQAGTANAIEAQSRYEQFLNFYPLHPMSSYARFQLGACLLLQANDASNDQEYARRARDHFVAMLRDLRPQDPWRLAAQQALTRAGDLLAEHDWRVAEFYASRDKPLGQIDRLSRLVDDYPTSQRREEAMYQLGHAYAEVGNVPQARLAFERLIADYPAGSWAGKAKSELAALVPPDAAPPAAPEAAPAAEPARPGSP